MQNSFQNTSIFFTFWRNNFLRQAYNSLLFHFPFSILLTTDTEDFQLWARITVYFWPWHIYETSNFASNWPHYHKWITFFFIQLLLIVGVVDCFAAIYVNTQLIGLFVSSWKIADNYLKRFMTPHVFNSRTICQHSAKKAALSL